MVDCIWEEAWGGISGHLPLGVVKLLFHLFPPDLWSERVTWLRNRFWDILCSLKFKLPICPAVEIFWRGCGPWVVLAAR